MTFVNEIIPEEAKSGFTFLVKTLHDGSKPTLWKWTIDKERQVALVNVGKLGGSYEGTNESYEFRLLFPEVEIHFSAEQIFSLINSKSVEITWLVSTLVFDRLALDRSEVERAIVDALVAMGWLYSSSPTVSVRVEFRTLV